MTIRIKLKQEVINEIYKTNVIAPKKVKDYLHNLWVREVMLQAKVYEHYEDTFSFKFFRKWTFNDSWEEAEADCQTFKEFLKNPRNSINLTSSEMSLAKVGADYLDDLYVCGSVLSMAKYSDGYTVDNKDLKAIRNIIDNQKLIKCFFGEGGISHGS